MEDRCDRCGAEAYHEATKGDLSLMFCKHHCVENAPKLFKDEWVIVNNTRKPI